MREFEWLYCGDTRALLDYLLRLDPIETRWIKPTPNPSDRKVRLFLAGWCRQMWDKLPDIRSQWAIETAELYADGLTTHTSRREVWGEADHANRYSYTTESVLASIAVSDWPIASLTHWLARDLPSQADLFREVMGNPHHLISCEPAWLTWNDSVVQKMAEHIYLDKTFDEFPILGDALEEAGCADRVILAHCRNLEVCYFCRGKGEIDGELSLYERYVGFDGLRRTCTNCNGSGVIPLRGPHVRGCHILDTLLGKK